MAIRVVSKGKIIKKTYTFKCNNCSSVLEADEGDVKHDYGEQRDPYHHISIKCPVCKKQAGRYLGGR